jgi:hypothetical protein
MTESRSEQRIVLGLTATMTRREPIESAASVARWLGSRMDAVLLTDPALAAFGAIPFAREFQPLARVWRDFGMDRLADECDLVATRCRRLFDAVSEAAGVSASFHGDISDPAEAFAKFADTLDVIALPAPEWSGEASVEPYPGLLRAALASASAILFLPRGPAPRRGPVLAFVDGNERVASLGAQIAHATNETLVLARARNATAKSKSAAIPGLRADQIRETAITGDPLEALRKGLREIRERIVIAPLTDAMTRQASLPFDIVAARRTPLLLVR